MVIELERSPRFARQLCDLLKRRAFVARHATYADVARVSAQLLALNPSADMIADCTRVLQRAIKRLETEERAAC